MRGPDWLTERPIAHRGLHEAARGVVENSLPAFEAAMAHGFAIECDVRAAADGVVVFHDATLDRLTGTTGAVAERPVAALRRVGFRDDGGATIPTLAELLELVGGRVPLFVELKPGPRPRRFEEEVAALARSYPGPLALMSFAPASIGRMKALAPGVARGLVSGAYDDPGDRCGLSPLQRFARRHILHAFSVSPHFIAYDVRALPAPGPSFWHVLGVRLLTWTVRTEADRVTATRHADQMIFEGFVPGA